jgi:hypothetical protein
VAAEISDRQTDRHGRAHKAFFGTLKHEEHPIIMREKGKIQEDLNWLRKINPLERKRRKAVDIYNRH